MKSRLLKSLLSSGLQALAVQILGVAFFYYLSLHISKDSFGSIGWANAVCMLLVTLLSFGMEQVVVRRVASSKSSDWAATAYLFHSFIWSLVTIAVLFLITSFSAGNSLYKYLPLFFVAQAFSFVATPLKQFLNAKERFAPYALVALLSNFAKLIFLFICIRRGGLSVYSTAYILIACAAFELISLLAIVFLSRNFRLPLTVKFTAYKKLLKEAAPQFLSVIFDSSLSRIDWILLGLLSTATATADYSFAYRAYEVARLPLSMIGPIILVRYSKLMAANRLDAEKVSQTQRLLAIEVLLAIAIVVVANSLWSPVIDALTNGKYGLANSLIFGLISVSLPLHFLINLLWTISFSAKKYRNIARITMYVAIFNLIANAILIPFLGGVGAAIAYLISNLLQSFLYVRLIRKMDFNIEFRNSIYISILGIAAYFAAFYVTDSAVLRCFISVGLLFTTSLATRQIRKDDFRSLITSFK